MLHHKTIFYFRPKDASDETLISCLSRASETFGHWKIVPGCRPSFESSSDHFHGVFSRTTFDAKVTRKITPDRCALLMDSRVSFSGLGWATLIIGFFVPILLPIVLLSLYFSHQRAIRTAERMTTHLTAECLFAMHDDPSDSTLSA